MPCIGYAWTGPATCLSVVLWPLPTHTRGTKWSSKLQQNEVNGKPCYYLSKVERIYFTLENIFFYCVEWFFIRYSLHSMRLLGFVMCICFSGKVNHPCTLRPICSAFCESAMFIAFTKFITRLFMHAFTFPFYESSHLIVKSMARFRFATFLI